jgi:CheY-like chemotaxis protein
MTKPTVVLVVEDEPLVRMDIVDQLKDRGFAVFEAGTAKEALDLLLDHPEIEVLFTDVDMPGGMDGLRLAAAVRDRWPPTRIIITSGHRDVSGDDMPGDSLFLRKPYTAEAVVLTVREALARS